MKKLAVFIIAIVITGGAGFALQKYVARHKQIDTSILGQLRPEFATTDLDGKTRDIKEWKGKNILLNFWATWCPPCRREIPDFIALQKKYGNQNFQIIGIAIDKEKSVRNFATKAGINYPIMMAEDGGIELLRRYGDTAGGLPYSVFINKQGKIVATITGELSKQRAISILRQLGAIADN